MVMTWGILASSSPTSITETQGGEVAQGDDADSFALLQLAHAGAHRRFVDADDLGQVAVGDAAVDAHGGDDAFVDLVQLVRPRALPPLWRGRLGRGGGAFGFSCGLIHALST
jgi:hypothetical protein